MTSLPSSDSTAAPITLGRPVNTNTTTIDAAADGDAARSGLSTQSNGVSQVYDGPQAADGEGLNAGDGRGYGGIRGQGIQTVAGTRKARDSAAAPAIHAPAMSPSRIEGGNNTTARDASSTTSDPSSSSKSENERNHGTGTLNEKAATRSKGNDAAATKMTTNDHEKQTERKSAAGTPSSDEDVRAKDADDKPETEDKKSSSILDRYLAPWAANGLRNKKTIKTLLRITVVTLVQFVFLFDQKTLNTMGQAGFFGLIVSIMLPPMFPTSLFLMVITTLVVGMCVGWAWSCAAMAAALQARSQTLLSSAYTKAYGSLTAGANPDAQFQKFIFQGAFLDARSSVVFGVFLFVGTYVLGAIRAKAPKLMLFSIFGTIVMDVMCSYGVLFPSAQYTLATQFLIPTGYYVATAVVSTLLIFPESMSHSVTDAYLDGFLRPALKLVKLQRDVLATSAKDVDTWSKHAETAKGLRKGTAQALAGLLGQLGPLGLEVSRGRLNAAQLSEVITRSKALGGRLLGVASFQMLVESALKQQQESGQGSGSRHEPRIQRYRKLAHEQEEAKGTGLDVLLPLLEKTSESLRSACEAALEALIDELDFTNRHRWSKKFPEGSHEAEIRRLQDVRQTLEKELAAFRKGHHIELLEPFRELFDGTTHLGLTSRSLFLCFVFSTNLIAFADALDEHLDVVTQMMARRPSNAIHPPTALSKIGYILTQKSSSPLEIGSDQVEEDNDSDADTLVEDSQADAKVTRARYRPDPDAGEPRNAVQRATRRLSGLFRWQSSPEGLFAFKYALISVALWLPMVFPRSAYFTYANRGLWALIMSQTGLGVFAGEQILGFLTRMSGTIVGAILGAVAWYIGAGRGTGEPYGLTAITLVMIVPLVFVRLVGPPQYVPVVLLTGVTIALVVGYSWVDYHLVVLSNSGKGIDIAWKRGLLVIIGFTAAFIISLFPRPVTSKEIVRKTLSRTIEGLGDFYAKEMRGFLGGVRDQRSRTELYRGDLLKLVAKLETIQPQLINAGVEPSLRGPWPKQAYHKLVDLHYTTLGALSLLASAYVQMKPRWMHALVERTAFFEPVLIADMLALYHSISNALDRGSPLPATIPLRERLAVLTSLKQRESKQGGGEEGLNAPGLGFKLHYDDVKDEQLAVYATACVALGHLVTLADEMHDVVKGLAGERTHDLDGWMRKRAERDADNMQLV